MKTILLVEDDKYLADIYIEELKKIGVKTEIAQNGKEALKKIKKIKPHLVILDIIMPNLDGWGVLEKINIFKKNNEYKNLKVVVCSNLASQEDIKRALKGGAEKYFIKTYFSPQSFVDEIKKILK